MDILRKRRCPTRPNFFGLSSKYIKEVYEQIFLMKYHGGWGVAEVYNLPIKLRTWFLERLVKQKELEAEQAQNAKK